MGARRFLVPLILPLAITWFAGCVPSPATQQATISGRVMDLATLAPIAGATVTVLFMEQVVATRTTIADGTFSVPNLPLGVYSVVASASAMGYTDNTATIHALDDLEISFALPTAALTGTYCSLCGKVTDRAGLPVAGALVQADGGKQTNGVFTSKITDAQGNFFLYAVPTKDTADKNIIGIRLMAVKEGYYTASQLVDLAADQTIAGLALTLNPVTAGQEIYADYDFETGPTGWTADGFWHWQANNPAIMNAAFPVYVSLSPLDLSGGAIPAAYSGTHCFWYGQAAAGNYLGVQAGDIPLSGGTSAAPNAGTLISPLIDLGRARYPVLTFKTWYEIEGVNPNANGYDLMTVEIRRENEVEFTKIGTLNPYVDPTVGDEEARHPLAYTSGGFNQTPNWIMITVGLSGYAFQTIQVRFTFETRDGLYNGFRGWFIDDVIVLEGPKPDEGWHPILPTKQGAARR